MTEYIPTTSWIPAPLGRPEPQEECLATATQSKRIHGLVSEAYGNEAPRPCCMPRGIGGEVASREGKRETAQTRRAARPTRTRSSADECCHLGRCLARRRRSCFLRRQSDSPSQPWGSRESKTLHRTQCKQEAHTTVESSLLPAQDARQTIIGAVRSRNALTGLCLLDRPFPRLPRQSRRSRGKRMCC